MPLLMGKKNNPKPQDILIINCNVGQELRPEKSVDTESVKNRPNVAIQTAL